jgi:hypothetical protein
MHMGGGFHGTEKSATSALGKTTEATILDTDINNCYGKMSPMSALLRQRHFYITEATPSNVKIA